MSKAILVMDMPDSCLKCPMLNGNDDCILQSEDDNFMRDTFEELKDNCPLKPVPEKKEERYGLCRKDSYGNLETYGEKVDSVAVGYNQCIDEIMKGSGTDE